MLRWAAALVTTVVLLLHDSNSMWHANHVGPCVVLYTFMLWFLVFLRCYIGFLLVQKAQHRKLKWWTATYNLKHKPTTKMSKAIQFRQRFDKMYTWIVTKTFDSLIEMFSIYIFSNIKARVVYLFIYMYRH